MKFVAAAVAVCVVVFALAVADLNRTLRRAVRLPEADA